MLIATICQEMKWTFEEYLKQPQWLIYHIFEKMSEDEKRSEKEFKK